MNQTLTHQQVIEHILTSSNPHKNLEILRDTYPETYWEIYESVLREGAKTNSSMFGEYCFRDPRGSIRISPEFHREWNLIWDLNPMRFFLMAPRDHAKTSKTVERCVWWLAQDPNQRIKIVCASDDRAVDIAGAISENIRKNEYVREVFPSIRPDNSRSWNMHQLFVERPGIGIKDASIEAFGVFSTATGGRADRIVFDDIIDPTNAQSETLRKKVKYLFYEVWLNLLEPEGTATVLGTKYHEDDLYTDLEQKCETHEAGWFIWKKPCIVKKSIIKETPRGKSRIFAHKPLWEEKFSMEFLENKRIDIGEKAFARQWLLKTVSDEDMTFEGPVWIAGARVEDVPKEWPRFMGVDLASALSGRGAYTVLFTAALSPDRHRYPLEIVRDRLTFNQICDLIVQQYLKHRHYNIKVESNAFQTAVYQHIVLTHPEIPISSIVTGAQKADAKVGIPSLALEFEKGLWIVNRDKPNLNEESVWTAWLSELIAYPNGKHTDTVMANWFCREAIRQMEDVSRIRVRSFDDILGQAQDRPSAN